MSTTRMDTLMTGRRVFGALPWLQEAKTKDNISDGHELQCDLTADRVYVGTYNFSIKDWLS